MREGERVRWYLFANSNEEDVHTPHWHGQTLLFDRMHAEMVHLEPMMMLQGGMLPDNVRTWLPTATSTSTSKAECRRWFPGRPLGFQEGRACHDPKSIPARPARHLPAIRACLRCAGRSGVQGALPSPGFCADHARGEALDKGPSPIER
jgi:hypothetical protein